MMDFEKFHTVPSVERAHDFRIGALFITRDALADRGEGMQSAQTTIKPRGYGVRYILWNITTPCPCPLAHLPTAIHPFNPFNSQHSQVTLRPVTTVVTQGVNGYIAICTVATINLPPSITVLERDSPIYARFTRESLQLGTVPLREHVPNHSNCDIVAVNAN